MRILRVLLVAVLFVGMAGLPIGCGGNGEGTKPATPSTEDVKKAGSDVKTAGEEAAEDVKKTAEEAK